MAVRYRSQSTRLAGSSFLGSTFAPPVFRMVFPSDLIRVCWESRSRIARNSSRPRSESVRRPVLVPWGLVKSDLDSTRMVLAVSARRMSFWMSSRPSIAGSDCWKSARTAIAAKVIARDSTGREESVQFPPPFGLGLLGKGVDFLSHQVLAPGHVLLAHDEREAIGPAVLRGIGHESVPIRVPAIAWVVGFGLPIGLEVLERREQIAGLGFRRLKRENGIVPSRFRRVGFRQGGFDQLEHLVLDRGRLRSRPLEGPRLETGQAGHVLGPKVRDPISVPVVGPKIGLGGHQGSQRPPRHALVGG